MISKGGSVVPGRIKGKTAQVSVDRCPADLVLFLGWLTEFVTLRFVRLVRKY